MTDALQLEMIEPRLHDAVKGSATVVLGGRRRDDLGASIFEPTIVDRVRADMALAREETFGPVVSIIPIHDIDEAVRVVNDCSYGLAGSVFGRDRAAVADVVDRFSTGRSR